MNLKSHKFSTVPCTVRGCTLYSLVVTLSIMFCLMSFAGEKPVSISGIYPHLTTRNDEGECGTGAVVLWQGDLWVVTYAPHQPRGSSDNLYQITPDLEQKIFSGSVGGTPANRMIHRESNQLLIGPYLIDSKKTIRIIPPTKMLGRLTGNARHLFNPANLVYYATMEEGLYEVDVNTLEVQCLIRDGHAGAGPGVVSKLPGYHGKGLYTGQGRIIYTNNGDRDPKVKTDPTTTSGALAQWFGEGDWQMVRRNQFTEAAGPGGIYGNPTPETDPVWTMGWDARSVILGLLENKKWYFYRLPKGSHSYDGAHGWNTEWPRIREIGDDELLATMHGTFWRFPATFSRENSAGIEPRSNYLKVIGDFCRWDDRIVFGCDDTAKSEFLNVRSFKAAHAASKQSNSSLWFVEPGKLDKLGPVIGRGSVWLRDDVKANQVSDAYLFSGYDLRLLHLNHSSADDVVFTIEIDRTGTNEWQALQQITVPAGGSVAYSFDEAEKGVWVRLVSRDAAKSVTAHFQYRDRDEKTTENDPLFSGVATADTPATSYGLMRGQSFDRLGLTAASSRDGDDAAYYEVTPKMEVVKVDDPIAAKTLVREVKQPQGDVFVDDASVLLIEDGKRYRLPKSPDFREIKMTEKVKDEAANLSGFLKESLSLNAKVSSSSEHADYIAEQAVDGKVTDDSRWIGNNEAGSETWVELDLGKATTFRSLWVVSGWKHDARYSASEFDIQILSGSGEWETIPEGEIRGNDVIECEVVLDQPVTAQKLRLITDRPGYFRIYEIAIFDRELPIEDSDFSGFGINRICREVATERDLLNVHGTFYELPARNAQGVAKIRPVATHNLAIHDFCSHNGLLFFTGIDKDSESKHIFRSADGKAAVWAGVVDDLWQLGKPRGMGGPWKNSTVKADVPSDPYLMTAYDEKSLALSSAGKTTIFAEVDIDGTGLWVPYKSWNLEAGQSVEEAFPESFSAYWIRFRSSSSTTVSAQLTYR